MRYIFLLSGDYPDLAIEEIKSLFLLSKLSDHGRIAAADINNLKEAKRLALTKSIHGYLFETKTNDLAKTIKKFDWNLVYKKDFCVRVVYLDNNKKRLVKKYPENKLADYIWNKIKNPKVNFKNPNTLIIFFISKKKAFCGVLAFENKENFESRKAHKRPFSHPSSLHPKVARALVNISEIKENEILLDPFCGTGGFLIEAGLMNIKSIGYDINKIMIEGCNKNLEYFKIKNCELKIRNALDIKDEFDSVVTDLPYGLNSNVMLKYEEDWKKYRLNKKIQTKDFNKNLNKFYFEFLKILREKLKKKAVIIFPDYSDYKELLKKSGFKIEKEFSNYVHRSLTRKIVKVV